MVNSAMQSRWAKVPYDVLGEIFLESIPYAEDERFTQTAYKHPTTLAMFSLGISHVCRQWRQAAIGFPKLWSFLDVVQHGEDTERESKMQLKMLKRTETYLERSGKYQLTILLTYEYSTSHTLLGRLLQESERWVTFCIDAFGLHKSSPTSTNLTTEEWDALKFPALRNLVIFNSDQQSMTDKEFWRTEGRFLMRNDRESDDESDNSESESDDEFDFDWDSDSEEEGDPDRETLDDKFQHCSLIRHYNYCSHNEFENDIVYYTSDAVSLRHTFLHAIPEYIITLTTLYDQVADTAGKRDWEIWWYDLQYAMLNIEETDNLDGFLHRFAFPALRGLNLRAGRRVWDTERLLLKNNQFIVPSYFANLRVLRLCGDVSLSNATLTKMVKALDQLTDLTLEMRDRSRGLAFHLVKLLTPQPQLTLVPRLEHLRLCLDFKIHATVVDTLIAMLSLRFEGLPASEQASRTTLLQSFMLFAITDHWTSSSSFVLVDRLTELQAKNHDRWDIQIETGRHFDIWQKRFGGEFLLNI
ncbi:hypothetical protein MIND_01102900 [Mycena indigotica]|uniref:F-box domain-containing protein n=1 Tax=Mycena indigotica TaxID=2126181 RepID=A0A8H6SB15_9AGAR|nr:uncharacterized protein MIND_01102900 [Mycena indigotica]KAF7295628.1 hypothetical protein MIND_01102900 [Mycena indigotica]